MIPKIGETCPALIKEDYEYHLKEDCEQFCICIITNKPCKARFIADPEDRSSKFFGKGCCAIDETELKNCPAYGISNETFALIIKDKRKKE